MQDVINPVSLFPRDSLYKGFTNLNTPVLALATSVYLNHGDFEGLNNGQIAFVYVKSVFTFSSELFALNPRCNISVPFVCWRVYL